MIWLNKQNKQDNKHLRLLISSSRARFANSWRRFSSSRFFFSSYSFLSRSRLSSLRFCSCFSNSCFAGCISECKAVLILYYSECSIPTHFFQDVPLPPSYGDLPRYVWVFVLSLHGNRDVRTYWRIAIPRRRTGVDCCLRATKLWLLYTWTVCTVKTSFTGCKHVYIQTCFEGVFCTLTRSTTIHRVIGT